MKVPKQGCQIFRGTIYQMTTKYTICSVKNIPNGRGKDQMAKNIPESAIARTSKINPKFRFLV
jgi:hypothetical protein